MTAENNQSSTVDSQLPDGYKQTDVGIIPEDWDVEELGDLTTLLTNGFVGTATRHYTNSDNGILYIQGFNVEENSFNFTGIKRVTKEFHKNNSKSCLREGDLLTIQTGDVGLTTIVPKRLEGSNCHALIISRFKKNKAFPKFYSQYFNSFVGRNRLKDIETGTTMKHLNVGDMTTWKLPCPPLPEQQAIAEALSDVDALITSLDQLIAKKRNIKQGAMQQFFNCELSIMNGELKNVKLGELGSIVGGGTPSTNIGAYWDGNIAWCTPTDITALKGSKYLTDTARKISKTGLKNSAAEIIPVNSIVMTTRATIGECAINKIPVSTNESTPV